MASDLHSPRKKGAQPVTIRAFLTRLIFLCVLPLVLLALFLVGVHIRTLQRHQDQEAGDRALNIMKTVDRDLSARIAALQTISASPLMDDPPRLEEFYRSAQGFRENFTGHIVLADMSTQMLFNTRLPLGSPLPRLPVPKGSAAAPYVMKTGNPAVGDMFHGPIAKEPLVAVVVPVKRDGQTKALLLSIIETRQYQKLLDDLKLPSGYLVSIFDSQGAVIARRPLSEARYQSDLKRFDKRYDANSAVSHWSLVLEVPIQIYLQSLIFAGGALIIAIILVAATTYVGGRLVSRRLAQAVESITEKPTSGTLKTHISEIEAVRNRLDRANAATQLTIKELQQSEERYRILFEAANVGKSLTLPSGQISVNKAFCDMLGYERDELENKTWQDLTPQEDVERVEREALAPLLNGAKKAARFEKRYIHKNGSYVWTDVSVTIHRDPDGKPLYFIATVVDITERKRVEEALQYQHFLLQQMGRVAKIGGWEFDPATGKGTWTEEVARIHDLDPSDETSVEVGLSFYQGESRALVERATQEAIKFGKPYNLELEMISAKGAHKWVQTIGYPTIEDGKVVRVRGSFQDITERKQAEEELRKYRDHLEDLVRERTEELTQANLRLKELDRLKSMFIASMSHELRTPLNSIIGFTGIILMGMSGEISDIQKKQLGMVKKSARHLLDLINDVIDVSKIEAGKAELMVEDFDLAELVLEVKESFAVAAADKGLSLELHGDGDIAIKSDRRRVRQILANLVGNAIKFTETGGVVIGVKEAETAPLGKDPAADGTDRSEDLSPATATKDIEVTVTDTGVGIARESMARLFEAFSRIHIQGRPVVEGTGLGLYLSKRIADLLGGDIEVESEPGQGSTFTLRMPRVHQERKT